jgi:transcriptional regulator with XRE-family HTH domain
MANPALGALLQHWRRRCAAGRREVASSAGVSFEYYKRLEQGRVGIPSSAVLHAVGRALGLNADELAHLTVIANERSHFPQWPVAPPSQRQSQILRGMLDPVFVIDELTRLRGANRAGWTIIHDLKISSLPERSWLAWMVEHDSSRIVYGEDWETGMRRMAANLNRLLAWDPGNVGLARYVEGWRTRSPLLAGYLDVFDFDVPGSDVLTITLPGEESVLLDYDYITLSSSPTRFLNVWTAPGGSNGRAVLDRIRERASRR